MLFSFEKLEPISSTLVFLCVSSRVSSRSPFPPQIRFLAALARSRSHEAQFPLCDPWGFLHCLNPCHGGPIPSGSRLEAHLPPGSVVTGAQLPRCHTSHPPPLALAIGNIGFTVESILACHSSLLFNGSLYVVLLVLDVLSTFRHCKFFCSIVSRLRVCVA